MMESDRKMNIILWLGSPWVTGHRAHPMFMAVSVLSPVRTQSVIPALARSTIVAGTPS